MVTAAIHNNILTSCHWFLFHILGKHGQHSVWRKANKSIEVGGYHVEEKHLMRIKLFALLHCVDLEQVHCIFSNWQFALLQFLDKYNGKMVVSGGMIKE